MKLKRNFIAIACISISRYLKRIKFQTYIQMKNLILITMMSLFMLACGGSGKEKKAEAEVLEDATPVRIKAVQSKKIQASIFASGVVAPQAEIKLSFKTGGVIEQMYAQEGSTVYRGQLLATLNLSEIQAQVNQAKYGLEKSKRDLDRAKNLYTDSVATLEQVQNANTAQQLSASGLQIAEFNQRYSTIYAPVSGKVLRRFTEPNELIGPSMPVFLIGSTEAAWVVKVALSDKDVVRIKLGDIAQVKMDAHPTVNFKASVLQIAQIASQATGTYEVELLLETGNVNMIAGFIAQAEIVPQASSENIIIPISALVEADGDKGYVYVLEKDKKTVKKTQVKIALTQANEVALFDGLAQGTEIVTEGAAYLTNGSKIRIVK
jgi:RND family efflux transporter MFP subunit